MAKYIVVERSYINNAIVEPGETVEYDPGPDGTIGSNLVPASKKKATVAPSGDGEATGDGALV